MPRSQAPRPALFRTWLRFFLLLSLLTWGLRLLASALLAPQGLWPSAWWWGLRFDLAIASLMAGLTVLVIWPLSRLMPRQPRRGWLVPATAILLFAHLGDWLYWQETGRHLGYEASELMNSAGSLGSMLLAQWPYLVAILLLLALIALVPWSRATVRHQGLRPELAMLVVIVTTVLIVRGGIAGVPQSPDDAMRLGDPEAATAALNGAYATLHGLQRGKEHKIEPLVLDSMSAQEARQRVDALYPDTSTTALSGARPVNVIFVLLESWASEFMGPLEDGRAVTPHFDELASQGLSTRDMIAGGRRTTEGMFSLFCSYQNPPGKTIAQTSLAMQDYACLPELLTGAGWQSAFFQGSHENTSGTGAFAQSLGFQASFGKEAINERSLPENKWGVHDRDLYRFVLERMDDITEPMLVGINTNSTHDTSVPKSVERLIDNDGHQAGILNTLHMADADLGHFIETLKARDWQHPWLVVLVSDHTSRVEGTILARSRLPFALFGPGLVEPGTPARTSHQRDVAPTVADLLDIPMPAAMGHSLLDLHAPQIAEYHQAGTLGWISNNSVVEFSLRNPRQNRCFDWQPPASPGPQRACAAPEQEEIKDAYALTQQAQEALFSGTTQQFAPQARNSIDARTQVAGNESL